MGSTDRVENQKDLANKICPSMGANFLRATYDAIGFHAEVDIHAHPFAELQSRLPAATFIIAFVMLTVSSVAAWRLWRWRPAAQSQHRAHQPLRQQDFEI